MLLVLLLLRALITCTLVKVVMPTTAAGPTLVTLSVLRVTAAPVLYVNL